MIASVNGIIEAKGNDYLVVNVGGIGIKVFAPIRTVGEIGRVGDDVYLLTTLIVREDALTLYGFQRELERFTFDSLLSVSGIGPRLALAMLSTLTPEMIANAVHQEDPAVLATVPGVGKKTAGKIALDLKDKLAPALGVDGLVTITSLDTDVMEMLTALGFSIAEAQAAIQSIPRDAVEDIGERVRLALTYFDR